MLQAAGPCLPISDPAALSSSGHGKLALASEMTERPPEQLNE